MKLVLILLVAVAAQGLQFSSKGVQRVNPLKCPTSSLSASFPTSESKIHAICAATGNANEDLSVQRKPASELNLLELCLCGAFATAIGDFIMHPIDTIKISQQTAVVAKSMMATLVFILKTQGIAGLYQGVVPYVVGDGLSGAVKFGTFEMTCALAKKAVPHKYHKLISFVCAAVAMLACSFVLVPTEVIKTRLQAGSASSVSQAVVAILQLDGFKGLYAGYFATLVRDIPYTMLELGIYENLKGFLRHLREQGKTIAADSGDSNDELLAAAITGGVSAFITTPLDLVKTKLMMQTGSNVAYRGVWDVFTQLYSQGGLSGLFVGSAARVAWLLPFTTIYLGVYEKIKRSLMAKKERNLQKASDAP